MVRLAARLRRARAGSLPALAGGARLNDKHLCYMTVRDSAVQPAPRGLSPWPGDWQPDLLHREVSAAAGLVPVERRLSAEPSVVAPRGQAPWRPSACMQRLLAISHRSTGTSPAESLLQNRALRFR